MRNIYKMLNNRILFFFIFINLFSTNSYFSMMTNSMAYYLHINLLPEIEHSECAINQCIKNFLTEVEKNFEEIIEKINIDVNNIDEIYVNAEKIYKYFFDGTKELRTQLILKMEILFTEFQAAMDSIENLIKVKNIKVDPSSIKKLENLRTLFLKLDKPFGYIKTINTHPSFEEFYFSTCGSCKILPVYKSDFSSQTLKNIYDSIIYIGLKKELFPLIFTMNSQFKNICTTDEAIFDILRCYPED